MVRKWEFRHGIGLTHAQMSELAALGWQLVDVAISEITLDDGDVRGPGFPPELVPAGNSITALISTWKRADVSDPSR